MKAIILIVALGFPILAFSSEEPSAHFINAHGELFSWLLGLAILIIGFLLVYYINKADKNNQTQWERINNHEYRITTVEIEHNMFKSSSGCYLHQRKEDKLHESTK